MPNELALLAAVASAASSSEDDEDPRSVAIPSGLAAAAAAPAPNGHVHVFDDDDDITPPLSPGEMVVEDPETSREGASSPFSSTTWGPPAAAAELEFMDEDASGHGKEEPPPIAPSVEGDENYVNLWTKHWKAITSRTHWSIGKQSIPKSQQKMAFHLRQLDMSRRATLKRKQNAANKATTTTNAAKKNPWGTTTRRRRSKKRSTAGARAAGKNGTTAIASKETVVVAPIAVGRGRGKPVLKVNKDAVKMARSELTALICWTGLRFPHDAAAALFKNKDKIAELIKRMPNHHPDDVCVITRTAIQRAHPKYAKVIPPPGLFLAYLEAITSDE